MRRALLLAVAVLASWPAAAAATSIVRVTTGDPAALARLGFDVTENVHRGTADVVLAPGADARRLARAGYAFRTVVRSVEAQDRAARRADRAYAAAVGRSALPSGRTGYRAYGDYVRELAALAAGHPGLVRSVTLPGRTVLGEPIVGVEIARDVNRTDDGRPVYVVMGEHHAREWPSGEVAMELADDLASSYGRDARVTSLLDRARVYVVPVVNVDGFRESRDSGDERRKNCAADSPAEDELPCAQRSGVDLNRNYGAYWGGSGSSGNPSDDDYRGPQPWSEPESRAVHELSQALP